VEEGISLHHEYPSMMVVIENRPYTIQVARSEGAVCPPGEWSCNHVSAIKGNGYGGFNPSHPRTNAKYRAVCRETMLEAMLDGVRFALAIELFGEGAVT
jgi:hypothetical protein